MKYTEIVRWFICHRDNILKNIYMTSMHCMPSVLPISEEYVYKNTLGIKFFRVKKSFKAAPLYHTIDNIFEPSNIFESSVTIKQTSIFEEIYFIDYNSNNDSLTYVYAKDVNSGCYDTHMGLAIDLKKIPKTTISVNVWEFLNYDNYQILTLEELFVYKDILQPL